LFIIQNDSPEDFLRLTFDLFGENIIEGNTESKPLSFQNSKRRERRSPEMGSITLSEDGVVTSIVDPRSSSPNTVVSIENSDQNSNFNINNLTKGDFTSEKIWRTPMIPFILNNTNLHKNVLEAKKKENLKLVDSASADDLITSV
jgi:hypothetical protein